MAQLATLSFRDRQGNKLISTVTQLQKEGTHILLAGANDWAGRNGSDRVYLLAPYDCVVKAIGDYDNTVFFESVGAVQTPAGTYDHCWFMCTHMLDSDRSALGVSVGKTFAQGVPCYAEGTKGIGSGNHIHMEQGYGKFGGGSAPYYRSSDTFVYNGKRYAQYYPKVASGGKEIPLKDAMFMDKVEIARGVNSGKGLTDYYPMRLLPDDKSIVNNQIYVPDITLRIRYIASTSGIVNGYCLPNSYYNVLEVVKKENSQDKDFDWYKIGPEHWVAGVEGIEYKESDMSNGLYKVQLDSKYDYLWSVDGNKYGDKYDITVMGGFGDLELKNKGWEEVVAVNGSLFYTYDGQHFACGLEKSRGVNNQDVGMSAVSTYNDAMAIGCMYDGQLMFAKQSYIINHLDEYYGAITGIGIMLNGKAVTYGHTEFKSQYNAISGRTIIGEDADGNFLSYSLAGETGSTGLYGKDLYSLCKSLGFVNAICLDGGGSVWRRINGKNDIVTSRKVKNALILYKKLKDSSQTPTTPDDPVQEPTTDTEKEELKKQIEELTKQLNEAIIENKNLTAQKQADEATILNLKKSVSSLNNEVANLSNENKQITERLRASTLQVQETTGTLRNIHEITAKY